jgi:hypothetical protein
MRTFSFPGPWVGGVSLVTGPLLLLTGTLLRIGVPFFFPDQLAAYSREPGLMTAAYATFLAGVIALWPGVVAVAGRVGETHPGWAVWGGTLVVTGLFARAFHHGADAFAFSLTDRAGPAAATAAVGDYYTHREWVAASLSLAVMLGWVVLAVGCYRAHVLPAVRAVALALMSGLMIGVLKGSTWVSVVEVAGLAVAFLPLGVRFLREAGRPRRRTFLATVAAVAVLVPASVVLGQLG